MRARDISLTEEQACSLVDVIRENQDGNGLELTQLGTSGTLRVDFSNAWVRINLIGEYEVHESI
jgi:hypothetical protein